MIARLAGAALLTLGIAIAGLPGLAWFTSPPGAGRASASGFGAAGQLWLLPVLGAVVVAAGAGLVAARPGEGRAVARWAGPVALAGGLAALAFATWAAADPGVRLIVTTAAGAETVPSAVALAPAAVATPVVAGIVAALGAGATWAGRRR